MSSMQLTDVRGSGADGAGRVCQGHSSRRPLRPRRRPSRRSCRRRRPPPRRPWPPRRRVGTGATAATSVASGPLVENTAQPGDAGDSSWVAQVDVDGDSTAAQATFLWDDEVKVLYIATEDDEVCSNGGTALANTLTALFATGNVAGVPVGSGWTATYLDATECGAASPVLWGERFDSTGTVTKAGVATIDPDHRRPRHRRGHGLDRRSRRELGSGSPDRTRSRARSPARERFPGGASCVRRRSVTRNHYVRCEALTLDIVTRSTHLSTGPPRVRPLRLQDVWMIRVNAVQPGSLGEELGLSVGTELLSVNGRELEDFLDWEFLTADEAFLLHVRAAGRRGDRVRHRAPGGAADGPRARAAADPPLRQPLRLLLRGRPARRACGTRSTSATTTTGSPSGTATSPR